MARASVLAAFVVGAAAAFCGIRANASEVEVVGITSTLAERSDDGIPDEVSFSAFARSTGMRVGGVRLSHDRQTAAFQLPARRELLIRGFRVVVSSGKLAFCVGEANVELSADLRYQVVFDFHHNPSSPKLSRCGGRLIALDVSGSQVSVVDFTTEIVDEALPSGSRTLR